jgi:tetrahydromethanopterin S-methyltransferase subunit F
MVSVLGKDLDNTKDIHFVAEHLAAADPEAFPSIVQKWLTKETGASRTLQGGREAPTSLNDFLSNVYGVSGSNKRQNFGATMEGVALSQGKDPAAVRTGAEKLLDALQVVSRDRELASGVDTSAVKQAAQGTAVAEGAKMVGLAIGKPFGRALDRVMFQRTYKQIADALTSPNGVAELEALAKYDPSGEKAKSIVLNILRASGMAQGEK